MIINAAQCNTCSTQYRFDSGNRYKLLPPHWFTVYTNSVIQDCQHFCGRHCLSEWLHKADEVDSATIEYTMDNKRYKGVVYVKKDRDEKSI